MNDVSQYINNYLHVINVLSMYVCLDYSIDVISGKHYKMPRRIKILYMFQ